MDEDEGEGASNDVGVSVGDGVSEGVSESQDLRKRT